VRSKGHPLLPAGPIIAFGGHGRAMTRHPATSMSAVHAATAPLPSLDAGPINALTGNHRLLGTDQAAEYLGVSRKTLESWRSLGGGPRYTKLGRRCAYRLDWLDQYVENRSVSSTAEAKQAGLR
jgi:hypothetical protein